MRRSRPFGVKSTEYGPRVGSDRSNAFLAALMSTAFMISSCLIRHVRSSPSTSMAPGVDGRSHFS